MQAFTISKGGATRASNMDTPKRPPLATEVLLKVVRSGVGHKASDIMAVDAYLDFAGVTHPPDRLSTGGVKSRIELKGASPQ